MSLEIVRRIRGNVHGTIDVTALEDAVIGHEIVQRLRRIKQLAFLHYVFPGATHTRFEHSLGVMQLAGDAWLKLAANQRKLADYSKRIPNFPAAEKKNSAGLVHGVLAPSFQLLDQIFGADYTLQVLRLAGLLHDIGHPPFSHSGERFLPSYAEVLKQNEDDLSPYLKDFLEATIQGLSAERKDPATTPVSHETFSILFIDKILKETYAENPELGFQVDPRDVIAVINPEVEPARTSPILALGINKLLHELISGELDIDRMDYLIRDARECGVVYGIFDVGRILDSLSVYMDVEDKSLHAAISYSGLAAFEDYLRARQSMYLQVYFHKTAASPEAMLLHLAKMLGGWKLPAKITEYAGNDDNIGPELLSAAGEKLKDPRELASFEKLLKDLLYRRRLWKMAFEFISSQNSRRSPSTEQCFEIATQVMKEEGIPFEMISSKNSFTRFKPRSENERSRNYLRLIRKDEFQIPRVVPIEDYASFITANDKIIVKRLYAGDSKDAHGNSLLQSARQKIKEGLDKA